MRVVGGVWKGQRLVAPGGRSTRPTSDKVREAAFAILGALPETWAAVAGEGGAPAPGPEGSAVARLAACPAAAASRTPGDPAAPDAAASADRRDMGDCPDPPGVLAGHVVLDLFAGSGALGIEALSRGARSCTFVDNDRAALGAVRRNLAQLGLDGSPRVRVTAADVRQALQADARRGARYTLVLADPPYALYDAVRPALARLLPPVLAPWAVLVVETAAAVAAGLPFTALREKRYGDTRLTVLVAGGGDEEDEDCAPR